MSACPIERLSAVDEPAIAEELAVSPIRRSVPELTADPTHGRSNANRLRERPDTR
jgi:hypothetical protein